MVSLLLAGGYPLLPFVIGVKGCGDEQEDDGDDEEFHGWEQDRTAPHLQTVTAQPVT